MIHKTKWTIICALIATASMAAQEHLCVRDLVVPDYPPLARMARLQGEVVLDIQVLSDGHVADVKPSGGPRLLQREAERNIRQWTFRDLPAGTKFPLHHRITYAYRIEGKPMAENRPRYVFHLPDSVEVITNPSVQYVD